MKMRPKAKFVMALLVCGALAIPYGALAQQSPTENEDGVFFLGSFVLSVLHFPLKLATCVGTQAGAAVAYTATYGVEGNYDGGTNGRDIGETANRACTGSWLISPDQVKHDYE